MSLREIIKSVVISPFISITTNRTTYTTPRYPDFIEQSLMLNGKIMPDHAKLLTRTIKNSVYTTYLEYSVSGESFIPMIISKHKFILDGGDICEIHTMRFEN
jgi:hypothetical protein